MIPVEGPIESTFILTTSKFRARSPTSLFSKE